MTAIAVEMLPIEVGNEIETLPISHLEMLKNKLELCALDADDDSSCGNHSEEGGLNYDSDPKDSGIDCGSTKVSTTDITDDETKVSTTDIPDDETAEQIMKTVEFYLSDANVLKDPFLLKHLRRNKEGYVSLKLLASFRKVRSLSRNWKAVAHSVQKSELLSLNPDCTKVKRVTPVPDYDETVSSRSIIVHGFSSDKPSVDSISEMFSQHGDIALVRMLRPGGSIPTDVKRFLSKNPEIQAKVCALVEFEEYSAAKKALEDCYLPGIKVLPIITKTNGTQSPKATPGSPQESPKKKKKNRKGSKGQLDVSDLDESKRSRRSSSGSVSSQSSGYLSSSPGNHTASIFDSKYPRRHSFNPAIYNDPKSSFASLGHRHRERLRSESAVNPWRVRKEQMLMQSDSSLSATGSSPSRSSPLQNSVPVKTIRLPKGPDGTNGFGTKSRVRLPSTAE